MVLIGRPLFESEQEGEQRLLIRRAEPALEVCGHQILEAGHDLGGWGEDGLFEKRLRLGPLGPRPADHPGERRPNDDDPRVERVAAGAVFGKDQLAPRLQTWAAGTAGGAQTDEQEDDRETPDGFGSLGSGTLLVGAERFELSTSRTRTVRSTGLSHAPTIGLYP